jgi:lipopolysaccharide export system permease protein
MRIIDRYMLRQFVQTFLICYLSLTGIYIVFGAFTNLEAFLRCARGKELFKLLGWYYGCQSIFFFDRMSSLLALMAAMFTVTWIQRHNEMTALMAAGVSRIRIVAPVIIAAAAVSVFSAVNREVIIPRFREQLSRRPTDPLGNAGEQFSFQSDCETDILFRGKATFADQQRIERPDFLLQGAASRSLAKYGNQLVADNAFYHPAEGDRPAGYLFDNVQEPKNLAKRPSLSLDGKPVIITPMDRPDWLKPNQCFVVSNLSFEQLRGQAFRDFSSTAQLIAALRNSSLDYGADLRVKIHSRIVLPLLDITLLFLGLPLVVARESRNVFIAIGMCMGVVTLFMLVVIGFQELGSAYLYPSLAAWAPLMLFVPGAVGLGESMWER